MRANNRDRFGLGTLDRSCASRIMETHQRAEAFLSRLGRAALDCVRALTRSILVFLPSMMPSACAVHKQVQYFAAMDPDTGVTNYYRMTVTGSGGMGISYRLQAGYFSAAAVDVLRGSMPKVPVLDLPVEQLEVFDGLTQHLHAALIQEAKRVQDVPESGANLVASQGSAAADRRLDCTQQYEAFEDERILRLARVVWMGSLSSSDLASIGMTGNLSPYQFRKLVFWATGTNVDLNQFAGEIDGVIDNAVAIASAAKTQRDQKKKQAKARREGLQNVIDFLPFDPAQKELIRGLLESNSPAPPENEGPTGLGDNR